MLSSWYKEDSGKVQTTSAMSNWKVARKQRRELMYLATLLGGWDDDDEGTTTPSCNVQEILHTYQDRMPVELPLPLPIQRAINYGMELLPSAKPTISIPYRMSGLEMVVLKKQLEELLAGGYIPPTRLLTRCQCSLRGKRIGVCDCALTIDS